MIYHLWNKNQAYDAEYQKNSPKIEFEATQDNHLKSDFSEMQIYDKKINNETENKNKEKIYIDCKNRKQSRWNSKMLEI